MADDTSLLPLEETPGPMPKGAYRRRRPALIPVDEQPKVAERVLEMIQAARNDRTDWNMKRLARYYKYRGWTPRENGPWEGSSDQHIPFIMTNILRIEAGLYNAVLGIRPIVQGKALDISHRETAVKNDSLLDYQMFVENKGEAEIEKYISNFVQEGTAFSYQPRIVERGETFDVRRAKRPVDGIIDGIAEVITKLAAENNVKFHRIDPRRDDGYSWTGFYIDPKDDAEVEVPIEVYDADEEGDDRLTITFQWPVTMFDGPTMITADIEDIIAPMRSENLQPISGANPGGAPWVVKRVRVPLSVVRARIQAGVYDLLSDADMEELEASAVGRRDKEAGHDEQAVTEARDASEGTQPTATGAAADREWVTVYEWMGSHELKDDGECQEVVLTVLAEARRLARARYLSEVYPATPPVRPFSEARILPVPGHLYGIGMIELMEGLNDFLHDLINDNVDAGRISSIPWFGYAASCGLKPEDVRLGPGDGIPLQNPTQDLAFYNLPGKDQSWSFNMIGLAQQWLEREVQIGPIQMGQVPQGKASALRTVGTTMAILQQGAAMPEQILRRLLHGLKMVYEQFHLINSRFLPPNKRFLLTGQPIDNPDSYVLLADRTDINIPLVFEFQANLTNTNKGLVAESLQALAGFLINPLFVQTQIVGPEQMYHLARDYTKAVQGDPTLYLKKPSPDSDEPPTTVTDAIRDLSMGVVPASTTYTEGAMAALAKFAEFMASDKFGLLNEQGVQLFGAYVLKLKEKAMREMQQQQMMQAAAQFQQAQQGGQGQAGPGAPPGVGTPPPPQTQSPTAAEVAGGMSAPH